MPSSTEGSEMLTHALLQLRTDTTFCAMHAEDSLAQALSSCLLTTRTETVKIMALPHNELERQLLHVPSI